MMKGCKKESSETGKYGEGENRYLETFTVK